MQPDSDAADGDEDASGTCSFSILQLAPNIPFGISFQIPFSRNRVSIGKDSLGRLRKRSRLDPGNPDAHITLAAHLLSEEPVLPASATEAAGHLQVALALMPPHDELGDESQWKAMIHKFLGDALNILGERTEARHHWERAISLDPVSPPHGIAGEAQKMLNKYPL